MERETLNVQKAADGLRLDRFLALAHPEISRSAIQREIRDGRVSIEGEDAKRTSQSVRVGQSISWCPPQQEILTPRDIPLPVLFEDDDIAVIDKPIGLVVHPGAGTRETTLVEGLLATRSLPASDDASRPGIVHRLDKETSGVIVVAKTTAALEGLQRQFADRVVSKTYLAVIEGTLEEEEGLVDAPIGRDPTRPSRMAVAPTGRKSQTEFDVLERLGDRALLLVRPRTGRTHQIRVHFSYIGHPVVGDAIYTGRLQAERLMLHAWRLALQHPRLGEEMRFEAPIPDGFPPFDHTRLPWNRIPEALDSQS